MKKVLIHCLAFLLMLGCTRVVYEPPKVETMNFVVYDTPPVPIEGYLSYMKNVRYPMRAQRYGIEGTVKVLAYVNELGFATEVKVLEGIPSFGLNETAVEAIRKTRFRPASYKNQPVGTWVSIPIKFRLPLETKATPTYDPEEVIFESPESIYHERYSPEERTAFKVVLNYLGYDVDPDTPNWDKRTDKALREFQTDNELTGDGRIGPITLFTLENALREEAVVSISRQDYILLPVYSEFWNKYVKGKQVQEGELLKYYDYNTGQFKYAEIEYMTEQEVGAYDYNIDEVIIDIIDSDSKK